MNNTKKLRSALLSSLTIIASIVLGHTAQAVDLYSLYFEEERTELPGTQLDKDNILDINVTAQQKIKFKIFINTAPLFVVKKLNYKVEYDTTELTFQAILPGDPRVDKRSDIVIENPPLPTASFTVSTQNGLNLNILPNQQRVHITTIQFLTTQQPLNDGEFDFKISGAGGRRQSVFQIPEEDIPFNIFAYGLGEHQNGLFQQVEVQTPEPTSILGLFSLGIIGAGATIKRQVKRNHSIEKETTKIG
ncbi:MAG: PEP-CTERM sorting domain-containing protein [Microcystis aeruginosa Ma_MB_S_20031200_S102]|uniref:PEP-CTERM sorting domain-containing protein n=1 Tax=Microcystis aeruginosa Ma_MB_S_20031200_S102 TaxID=2486254 RepID=A0A552F4Y5_MICAE|nr:MAG: PEP-CTERM sorting domain-containing protein [Microcystis aeruginosa Ma_MB_S_20031200_S102D]TRU41767.1 MAG: PEP-CTERM sorting domain-containing protein [Microcystis aeruginosa Ma_MB_S_20031200_S102]